MTSPRLTIGVAISLSIAIAAVTLTSGCNQPAGGTTQAKSVPEDDPAPVAKATKETTAKSAPLDDAKFQVPDGPADKLLSFINGLASPEPFQSNAEAAAYQTKAVVAIGAAADKVLAGEVTEQQVGEAIQWKLESLRVTDVLAGAQTTDSSEKFLEKLLEHDRIELKRAAVRVRLDRGLRKWQSQTIEERLAAVQTYIDSLRKNGVTLDDARLLASLSNVFSQEIFATSDAAAAPYREVVALLRESTNPEINKLVPEFEATVRRLELPGKKFALEGKLLDGTPIDWNSYRGKVVLIDFWATDCEDCMVEVPSQVRHLRMYRDKGFEIVGVNMNRDAEEVKRVMSESGITWPTLFETHSEDERWAHPIADNLAINAIPQLILLDKDGTVVHMSARGPKLGEELRKLLGEPAAPAEDFSQAGVPDGTPTEILDFVKKTVEALPQPRSREEQMKNQEKFRLLLGAAIEKVLAGKPNVEQTGEVIQMKIATLRISNVGQDEGERQLVQFLERLASHEHRPVAAAAVEIQLLRAIEDWETTPPAKRAELVDRYIDLAKEGGPDMSHVALLEKLATMSGLTGDEKLAAKAVSGVLPLFADKSTPQIAKAAEILEGTSRRLNLPGNMLELEGTFMDGTKLDWESYRGKVVLVDFWASWCGPCRAEIPNIKRNLEAYKSKGFEVIGVCVDDDRTPAEAYIKEAGVSWPSLMGTKTGETGFDQPVARKYGLTGIPLAILVDRDGKVVSLLARGPLLEIQLRELLDKPAAK